MPNQAMPKPNHEFRKVKKVLTIYLVLFLTAAAFGGGFVWGRFGGSKFENILNYYQNYLPRQELPEVMRSDLLKLIWGHLTTDYLRKDQMQAEKMYYSAIAGFVQGVDDPYTVFLDPELNKEFEENLAGEFEGIGAEIGIKDERLTIVAPMPGSPAEQAGILAGDMIFAIDGLDTTGITTDKAVKLIRGPKGTTVTLLIMHANGDQEPLEITVTRDKIELPSLKLEFREDGLAYIYLANFYEDSDQQFDRAIEQIKEKAVKGIIFDLRNNPGGLLGKANYITAKWLKPGSAIVVERFGDGRKITYEAKGKADLLNIPTVVLINKGSASGSEILAGALKDHHAAVIVGETSFGKGSVQELRKLPDGSSLKMTIAEWLTPNETTINEKGVEPDIEVKMTYEDYKAKRDLQLDKAVELLLNNQN